jgi:hypothetical protein
LTRELKIQSTMFLFILYLIALVLWVNKCLQKNSYSHGISMGSKQNLKYTLDIKQRLGFLQLVYFLRPEIT